MGEKIKTIGLPTAPSQEQPTENFTPDSHTGNGQRPESTGFVPSTNGNEQGDPETTTNSRVSRGLPWPTNHPANPDIKWQRRGTEKPTESTDGKPEPQGSDVEPSEGSISLSRGNSVKLLDTLGVLSAHGESSGDPALSYAVGAARDLLRLIGSQVNDTTKEMADSPYSSPR